jgi:hypothetical protein
MRLIPAAILTTALALGMFSASVGAATRSRSKHPELAVPTKGALPVISCATSYGAGSGGSPFVARELPATSDSRGLRFYSNGLITVLAPAGWACGALVAADGGQELAVYPPGKPDYSTMLAPKGAELVEVQADYTGHLPGAELVCNLFPHSAAATEVRQSGLPNSACMRLPGEEVTALTPDVVAFNDPAGVRGSGTGSGGSLRSLGAAVYPQLASGSGATVNVTMLSCTLPRTDASLCKAIEGDYLVRNPPTYTPPNSG